MAENIADNGGIREALWAYRSYIMERGMPEGRLPGLEQLTPEQIFFLAFAQVRILATLKLRLLLTITRVSLIIGFAELVLVHESNKPRRFGAYKRA